MQREGESCEMKTIKPIERYNGIDVYLCNGENPKCRKSQGCCQNGGPCERTMQPVFALSEEERMKEICKNCENCKPTYKGYYCDNDKKKKKVKLQGTCDCFREKHR